MIEKRLIFIVLGSFFVWACGDGRDIQDGSSRYENQILKELIDTELKNLPSCNRDSDCVLVSKDCCGCNSGGESIAIHKSLERDYNDQLRKTCSAGQACFQWYRCDDFEASCHSQKCSVGRWIVTP